MRPAFAPVEARTAEWPSRTAMDVKIDAEDPEEAPAVLRDQPGSVRQHHMALIGERIRLIARASRPAMWS